MITYYLVIIEYEYSKVARNYPTLFEAYRAYDKVNVGIHSAYNVSLYEKTIYDYLNDQSSILLCYKWYDFNAETIYADQDKLHIQLGKRYYKFIEKAKSN